MTDGVNNTGQLLSQWVVSIAVSVVCCAVLFLLFAGYIMDLQGKTSLAAVRLDVLQERQGQLVAEIDALRHPAPVAPVPPASVNPLPPVQVPQVAPPSPSPDAPVTAPDNTAPSDTK